MKIFFIWSPLVAVWLLAAHMASAQYAPVKFEQLPPELNLAQGGVNCILQDHRGILWLGTWSGLVRYDGYKVRVFQQESGQADGLQSDQITSLLEDHSGRLWIGTLNAGLQRFDRATERFVNFRADANNPNSLSDNDVWGLFEDSKGYIWVGTKRTLNRFDPVTSTFLRITEPTNGSERPSSDYIYSICETPDGSIWSATAQGLNRIRFTNDRDYDVRHYSLDTAGKDISLDNFIYRVRPALQEANTLWLGTKAGLKKVVFRADSPDFLQVTATFRHSPGDPTSLSHNIVSDFWEVPHGVLEFKGYNIRGFWVRVRTAGGLEGYVFDGYLSRYKAPGTFEMQEDQGSFSTPELYMVAHSEPRGPRIEIPKTPNRYEHYKQIYQNSAQVEVNIGEGGAAYKITFNKGTTLEEAYLIGRLLWLEGKVMPHIENGIITVNNETETQQIIVLNKGGTIILTLSIAD